MCSTAFGWNAWRDRSCPGVNIKVEQQSHHACLGCEVNGVMLILIEWELVIIFSAIVIIDRFLLLVIIIVIDGGQHWLTQCWHMASVLMVKYSMQWLLMNPMWWWLVHRWFITMPSFCPSFPHHRQMDNPPHHCKALGEWIPFMSMILGDLVGGMILKKWMTLGEVLAMWWVALRSFQLVYTSGTSWTSEPIRLVEIAISLKVEERSYDPLCL